MSPIFSGEFLYGDLAVCIWFHLRNPSYTERGPWIRQMDWTLAHGVRKQGVPSYSFKLVPVVSLFRSHLFRWLSRFKFIRNTSRVRRKSIPMLIWIRENASWSPVPTSSSNLNLNLRVQRPRDLTKGSKFSQIYRSDLTWYLYDK
jgi:hypothetical protein